MGEKTSEHSYVVTIRTPPERISLYPLVPFPLDYGLDIKWRQKNLEFCNDIIAEAAASAVCAHHHANLSICDVIKPRNANTHVRLFITHRAHARTDGRASNVCALRNLLLLFCEPKVPKIGTLSSLSFHVRATPFYCSTIIFEPRRELSALTHTSDAIISVDRPTCCCCVCTQRTQGA